MALIGIQTNGLSQIYGIEGAYREMKAAGFDAADVGFNALLGYQDIVQRRGAPAFDGDWEQALPYFRPFRDAAEKYGVENAQAHAPYPSYVDGLGDYNEYLLRAMERCLKACAYVGCKKLVIHPFFNGYDKAMAEREEWDFNIACYSRLIPAAKEHGVMILLENMFTRNKGKIYEACCSDFAVASRYVDTLNEIAGRKVFGFCLDTGHALLLGKDIRRSMRLLGRRIQAFHLHDNNGIDDQHLAPYMGVGDWDRFVDGLREIGYQGHLSFETHRTFTSAFDPALAPEALRVIARAGRLFAERAGIRPK